MDGDERVESDTEPESDRAATGTEPAGPVAETGTVDVPPGRQPTNATDDPSIGVGVVSIAGADSRDADGPLRTLVDHVEAAGHEIAIREGVAGDFDGVQATVSRLADREDVDAVFAIGGVGIGPDDATVRAVRQLLDAEMPAFETLVTTRAAAAIGEDVLTIRPLAGVIDCVPVFCVPADETLVDPVMTDVVRPQLARVVELARPSGSTDGESEGNT